MRMPDPLMEKLLALQAEDTKYDHSQNRLDQIPREVEELENRIQDELGAIEQVREEVKEKEVLRRDLETEAGSEKEDLLRYRNQQLAVRKNEEYQALEHEIALKESRISELDDEQLEILVALDDLREQRDREEKERRQSIEEFKRHIGQLHQHQEVCRAELEGLSAQVRQSETEVPQKISQVYEYVKSRVSQAPYVVPLRDQQCGGCFLRVSYEVVEGVRRAGELHRCDSCGRILYNPG